MKGNVLGTVTTIAGGIILLAIIATLAVNPAIVKDFFGGIATDVTAAEKG